MLTKKLIKKVLRFSLELTNICNLDCDFCANRLIRRERGMMDVELAKRIIKEVKDTKFCSLISTNLMGEPLLYRDLPELLEYANALKQNIFLITNGEKLDKEMSQRIFRYPPAEVSISYNSGNEKSYNYKHSGGSYEQYRNRIFDFVELKYKLKAKTPITLQIISTYNMPHDKFKILDEDIDMRLFQDEWITFARLIKKKYKIIWQVPDLIYPGANMLLPDFHINLYFFYHLWTNNILPSGTKVMPLQKSLCPWPFIGYNVLWNGDLVLCCFDYNGDMVYDNIRDKSIIEAFNSDKILKIRKKLIEGKDIPQRCAYCSGKLLNLDSSDYNPNPTKKFYKLSKWGNLKRRYFRIYRFLWKVYNFRFSYRSFIIYNNLKLYIRKQYGSYYKNYLK